MAGGSYIEKVTNHDIEGTHEMHTFDGRKLQINSKHTKMMYPWM